MYTLLGVYVKTDKHSDKVTLTQVVLTNKVLNKVLMLDSNKNTTPTATIPLVTYDGGPPFG